jgi:hypothetical protein
VTTSTPPGRGPVGSLWGVSQTLKPLTAAQKLGVHLPATPAEFQSSRLTREEVEQLRADRQGPVPRDVVAQKLRISRSGLARAGVPDALDADQIGELLADPPAWLLEERRRYTAVVAEKERVRGQHSDD